MYAFIRTCFLCVNLEQKSKYLYSQNQFPKWWGKKCLVLLQYTSNELYIYMLYNQNFLRADLDCKFAICRPSWRTISRLMLLRYESLSLLPWALNSMGKTTCFNVLFSSKALVYSDHLNLIPIQDNIRSLVQLMLRRLTGINQLMSRYKLFCISLWLSCFCAWIPSCVTSHHF